MAVTLRLVRLGRRNRAFFRIRVGDERFPPSGRFIEEVGFIDPMIKDRMQAETLDRERIEYWLNNGAKTSETVASILKRHGISANKSAKPAAAGA